MCVGNCFALLNCVYVYCVHVYVHVHVHVRVMSTCSYGCVFMYVRVWCPVFVHTYVLDASTVTYVPSNERPKLRLVVWLYQILPQTSSVWLERPDTLLHVGEYIHAHTLYIHCTKPYFTVYVILLVQCTCTIIVCPSVGLLTGYYPLYPQCLLLCDRMVIYVRVSGAVVRPVFLDKYQQKMTS